MRTKFKSPLFNSKIRLFLEKDDRKRSAIITFGMTFRNEKWANYTKFNLQSNLFESINQTFFKWFTPLFILFMLFISPFLVPSPIFNFAFTVSWTLLESLDYISLSLIWFSLTSIRILRNIENITPVNIPLPFSPATNFPNYVFSPSNSLVDFKLLKILFNQLKIISIFEENRAPVLEMGNFEKPPFRGFFVSNFCPTVRISQNRLESSFPWKSYIWLFKYSFFEKNASNLNSLFLRNKINFNLSSDMNPSYPSKLWNSGRLFFPTPSNPGLVRLKGSDSSILWLFSREKFLRNFSNPLISVQSFSSLRDIPLSNPQWGYLPQTPISYLFSDILSPNITRNTPVTDIIFPIPPRNE